MYEEDWDSDIRNIPAKPFTAPTQPAYQSAPQPTSSFSNYNSSSTTSSNQREDGFSFGRGRFSQTQQQQYTQYSALGELFYRLLIESLLILV